MKKYVIHYQNSLKHGIYTEWSEDGRLTKDITYDYDIPISEYLVDYYGSGYTEINRRNGELSGSWIKWYSNGKKNEEGIYKNGEKGGFSSFLGWVEGSGTAFRFCMSYCAAFHVSGSCSNHIQDRVFA